MITFAGSVQAEDTWEVFADQVEKFSIEVPPGWSYGEGGIDGNRSFAGASGTRRVIAWIPEGYAGKDCNVTLVITNVGADFTSMGSFGTAYSFGSNLVGSMDQSYMKRSPAWARPKGPIQEAVLIDTRDESGVYQVEYTVFKEPDPMRHLLSRIALGYNGRYNRLYTLTAQAREEDWPAIKSAMRKMVASFKPPKGANASA